MSIHLNKPDYQCSKCQSLFLPYKIGIKCPNCESDIDNADTEEYLNTLGLVASSMRDHKERYGTYFPGAWSTSNIIDNIQKITFMVFDAMEETKPANKHQYLMELLDKKFDWGERLYLRAHVKGIISEIYKIYEIENFSEIECPELDNHEPEESFNRSFTKLELFKNWLKKFLP